jgi:fibronectin type 3 domain-containing protein
MKSLRRSAWALSLIGVSLIVSGCADAIGEVTSMTAVKTDPSLPTLQGIKTMVDKTGVGFEWKPITDKRVEGIDVYRAVPTGAPQEKYVKIATIPNRFATHYVDTTVKPDTTYDYTFKTFGVLFGSAPGKIIRVKTPPGMPPVSFVKAYQPSPGVVKILWTPHPDPRVADYIIQRRLAGGRWKYLATVKGRLSPEYIDESAAKGRRYEYRVVARSADGAMARPSQSVSVTVQ